MRFLNNGLYETLGGNYALFIECMNGVDLIIYVNNVGQYLSHDTTWWWD